MKTRIERDSLGELRVPADALYGPQTQRAVQNFPISGQRLPRRFLDALGRIKACAADANHALGLLGDAEHIAIVAAAREVAQGDHDAHFPIDVYQTGSGTSTNMNANEVIARRAAALGATVHPNDDVNRGQSSNDVIPTAMHVAGALALHEDLLPALRGLAASLRGRQQAFAGVLKSGRTHLMDATPMTVAQEVGGWASQVERGVERVEAARDVLCEVALGGTAVGTGINTHPEFAARTLARLAEETGLPFHEARDHFAAQGGQDAVVEAHAHLNTLAVGLTKIANDIRLLGSGPRTGLGELRVPAIQPGSSIMPGKVNPVLCEMLTMVAARVMGNHTTVTVCGLQGHLQLNTFLPLLATTLLESSTLLANGATAFAERLVDGLEVDAEVCAHSLERNLSLVTALAPEIGYDLAAKVAKEAHASGRTLREVALDLGVIAEDRLDDLLDPAGMIAPS